MWFSPELLGVRILRGIFDYAFFSCFAVLMASWFFRCMMMKYSEKEREERKRKIYTVFVPRGRRSVQFITLR